MLLFKKIQKSILIMLLLLTLNGCATVNRGAFKIKKPTRKVAVILPQKGEFAPSGKAIQAGLLGAYYADASPYKPSITFIDSSKGSINTLYQNAIKNGADFIIGPLTKSHLVQLAKHNDFDVPTLALNTLPTQKTYSNLYEFGLSPLDETAQTAKAAFNHGYRRALIITPNNSWGDQITKTFQTTWQQLGGYVITSWQYNDQRKFPLKIREFLGIERSYHRRNILRWWFHEKIRFTARRRQDIDMIFIAAPSLQAREIVPLLRFYYLVNMPIYAISNSYQGTINRGRDRDLNNVIFCDMPWTIAMNQLNPALLGMRQRLLANFKSSFDHYPRLFALGVDAYHVMRSFNKLANSKNNAIDGATGRLSLLDNQHIYRALPLAMFKNGKAQ